MFVDGVPLSIKAYLHFHAHTFTFILIPTFVFYKNNTLYWEFFTFGEPYLDAEKIPPEPWVPAYAHFYVDSESTVKT